MVYPFDLQLLVPVEFFSGNSKLDSLKSHFAMWKTWQTSLVAILRKDHFNIMFHKDSQIPFRSPVSKALIQQ